MGSAILVRKFRCLAPTAGANEAIEVLYKRNQLWNRLVEAFRSCQAEADALRQAENTDYARLNAAYVVADEKLSGLIAKKRKSRSRDATGSAEDKSALDASIAVSRSEKAAIATELKAARTVARAASKEGTDAIWKRFYETQKQLCAASGLWWGNHETVVEAFESARKKVAKGSAINFHRFDGTGILRVRQSGGGIPMDDVLSGELSMLSIRRNETSSQRSPRGETHQARHVVTMRIDMVRDDAGKKHSINIELPMIAHREFAVGQFKYATLRRDRGPSGFQWHIIFTCTDTADNQPLSELAPGRCAINFGWRSVKDGLRVATLATSNGASETVTLPHEWLRKQDLLEEQQGRLQAHALAHWPTLIAQLPPKPIADESTGEVEREHGLLRAIRNAKTPSYARIAALEEYTHQKKLEIGSALSEALRACVNAIVDQRYATSARQMYRSSEHLRAAQVRRRDQMYREYAASVAKRFGEVTLDDANYAEMAKVLDSNGDKTELNQLARANRVRASVGELRLFTKQAVEKLGGSVQVVSSVNVTRECSTCGHINESPEDIHFVCVNCHAVHDQDENAAKNLLERSASLAEETNA